MLLKIILISMLVGGLLLTLAGLVFLGSARIVGTDSMAPSLRAGDLVLLRPTGKVINPGTVVTYQFQNELITHRVVEVVGDMLVTKGDNNQEIDPWRVPFSDVVGVPRVRIPYGGYLLDFVRSPAGFLLLIVLPACWIIVIEARKIASSMRDSQAI